MPIYTLLRRHFLPLSVVCASLLVASMVWAQANPPLSSEWSPGAIPGGAGIVVTGDPVVTGKPFAAKNNSRMVMLRNGEEITYESHSIIARDSSGRIATRTPASPHVSFPNGKSAAFIPAGGSIRDPVTRVQLRWADSAPPPLGKVVMKNRVFPNFPEIRPQPLNPCEGKVGETRPLRNGGTEQFEDLGERTIQGIIAQGCRITRLIASGTLPNHQPSTTSDESWISPELRITLVHVFHASNGEDRIEQLDNITLSEPDPTLFEPPPGYEVRDMDTEREQQERAQFTVQPGQPDAEMLAGGWETDDPFASPPTQMGIRLKLLANRRVPYHQHQATGDGVQKFATFDICLYQRTGGEEQHGWFSATPSVGGASWDGQRLRMEYHGKSLNNIIQGDLALDLTYNMEKGFWEGSYTRGSVTNPVRFARPGASRKGPSNPFVGEWSQYSTVGRSPHAPHIPTCIYIAQGSDGAFVGWRNRTLGPIIDPRDGFDVATFQESDGDALGVQINGGTLTLQEGIATMPGLPAPGKAPAGFTGKLSPDGTQIIGSWVEHGPELPLSPQAAVTVTTFTRMTEGQSCWSQPPSQ